VSWTMDQSQDVRAAGGSGEHSGLGPESAAGSPLRDGDEVEATQCAPEEESFISTQREALPAIWMAPVQDVAACAEPFVLNPDAATTVGALRSTGGVHTCPSRARVTRSSILATTCRRRTASWWSTSRRRRWRASRRPRRASSARTAA